MTDKKDQPTSPHVYQAINRVQAALAKEGIGKDRKNTQQNYNFRGIDDVFNHLAPHLAEHGLCILPRVLSREVTERVSKKYDNSGNPRDSVLFYVVVEVEYHFVSSVDGSGFVSIVYGEAMDSGDKATNKAMSAAYKYACLQAFCIPTEGDNDADATTHEVAPKQPAKQLTTPVFESEAALITFSTQICQTLDKATTEKEVDDIKFRNLKTFELLGKSNIHYEVKAINEIRSAMRSALERTKAAPAKTVASAMKPAPIIEDEIPF